MGDFSWPLIMPGKIYPIDDGQERVNGMIPKNPKSIKKVESTDDWFPTKPTNDGYKTYV